MAAKSAAKSGLRFFCGSSSRGNLLREFLRGIRPDFGERGMIVGHGGEFIHRHAFGHGDDNFMEQVAAHWADAGTAEDFTGFRVRQ